MVAKEFTLFHPAGRFSLPTRANDPVLARELPTTLILTQG